jgi:hypothetical protein
MRSLSAIAGYTRRWWEPVWFRSVDGAHRIGDGERVVRWWGKLLHIDGSKHRWFGDDRWYDLLVILGDATSEIYQAQLVEEESTRSVMAAWWEVVETRGLLCALCSDRVGGEDSPPHAAHAVRQPNPLERLVERLPPQAERPRGAGPYRRGTWFMRRCMAD